MRDLATTTAPTMATSSSSDTASKGSEPLRVELRSDVWSVPKLAGCVGR